MRIIFFALCISAVSMTAFSQDQPPSQKQIQAQLKQAKTEAQQQIIDYENEIAEAKKNNEDPEMIREMEKNLATLKKMMGVLDKASDVNKTNRPETIQTSSPLPQYKSPFVRIALKEPVATPTEAQAKDHLLWYKGKKINANTLITTKGRVVQYNRVKNTVIVQPNNKADSPIINLIVNLGKSRQWTNNYVNTTASRKNSFFDYPLVMMAMKELDLIEQEYNKIADNTINLPGTGTNLMAAISQMPATGSGPFVDYKINLADTLDPDAWLRQMQQELLNLLNNPPPLDFPAPPKHEFDLCYYCDPSLQAKYYRNKQAWGEKFTEYEDKLISIGLSIYRQFALLGNDISDSGIPTLEQDIDRANKFAMQRLEQKLELLKQRYKDDVFRQEVVISTILGFERQKALLGVADENAGPPDLNFIKQFDDYIKDQIAAKNYNVIFNYAMILGHARQQALLGVTDEGHEMDLFQQVFDLNRFALTIDIDFAIEFKGIDDKPDMKVDGNLSTSQKIYVRLGRNKECKWQFYLFDPDYGSIVTRQSEATFRIPITANGGTKKIRVKEDQWESYSYSGPTEMQMDFPSFSISFCQGSGPDSAMVDILRYKQESLAGYEMRKKYTVDFLGYVNKIFVSLSDVKANQNELVDLAGDMMTTRSQATVDHPTGYAKLDKMQVNYKLNGIQHDLQKKLTETAKVGNTVISFDAQNGSDYLINGSTDTAHEEYNIVVKKGVIKLKVVLEPL
jgi:hypothetical protein